MRPISRRMGPAMVVVGHRVDRMLGHPSNEGHQRKDERADDRGSGDAGGPLAMVPESGAGKKDHGKRHQGQQPGEPEERRQE